MSLLEINLFLFRLESGNYISQNSLTCNLAITHTCSSTDCQRTHFSVSSLLCVGKRVTRTFSLWDAYRKKKRYAEVDQDTGKSLISQADSEKVVVICALIGV